MNHEQTMALILSTLIILFVGVEVIYKIKRHQMLKKENQDDDQPERSPNQEA